jgi:hypothetical protein
MLKTLRWVARILTILFILFIGLFSIDVFFEGYGFPEVLIAFFMHNVPTILLTACLIVAWKKPKIGGVLFILLALASLIFFKTYNDLIVVLLITMPPAVIGLIFIYESVRLKTIQK